MKKRAASLLLIFALLLSPSALAVSNSADHFVRLKTYAGEFSDLESGSVFYDNVAALYEYGLSVGKADGTFGLTDSVTVGQSVIFAGRLRSLYAVGDAEAGADAYRTEGQAAYEPYLLYLQAEGALGSELDGTYFTAAQRGAVAHVLAAALPDGALDARNSGVVAQAYASRRYITDVTEYTPYYQDILSLYQWGISQGVDDTGSFLPDQPITRGALAAMLTRMVDEELRLTLTWDLTALYSAAGTTWGDLISGGDAYIAAPTTLEEMESSVRSMLAQGSNTLSLQFPTITAASARQVMQQSLSVVKSYCEQCYNSVNCTFDQHTGALTLTFSAASCTTDQLLSYRDHTLQAAIAAHDALWSSGAIHAGMSEYEKARVYFDWICQNCVYDYNAGDTSLSHIPYALFHDGTAVCDGYTGAYNLLLKLEGIECTALSNSSHIWTVAVLDGTEYHIDTTWGDSSGGQTDYNYFAMTAEQSWRCHSW